MDRELHERYLRVAELSGLNGEDAFGQAFAFAHMVLKMEDDGRRFFLRFPDGRQVPLDTAPLRASPAS